MNTTDLIREKIEETFRPEHFELINESHKHAGHAGDDGSGESHFKLIVVSKAFEGYNRIERHRMAYECLEAAFTKGLHALSMKLLTPSEFRN